MRNIEFRVWNAKDGWFFSQGKEPKLKSNGQLDCELGFFDELVVEQYTNVKDRNGKKIYEGDLIKLEYDANFIKVDGAREFIGEGLAGRIKRFEEIRKVEYQGMGWNNFTKANKLGSRGNETIEVIGNIHENPELLNETNC